jgi:hypothetical protein
MYIVQVKFWEYELVEREEGSVSKRLGLLHTRSLKVIIITIIIIIIIIVIIVIVVVIVIIVTIIIIIIIIIAIVVVIIIIIIFIIIFKTIIIANLMKLMQVGEEVLCVCNSPDGKLVAVGLMDSTVKVLLLFPSLSLIFEMSDFVDDHDPRNTIIYEYPAKCF